MTSLITLYVMLGAQLNISPLLMYGFQVYAQDHNSLMSDGSNLVLWANTNRYRTVTLAWDRSPDPTVTNYPVTWWRQGQKTNWLNAGNTNWFTVELWPPPKTNLIVTFTYSGTTLETATNLPGQWTPVNKTSMSLTNYRGPMILVRGRGKTNAVGYTTLRY